jgi:AraC family transcriptional regulator, positive regulator of tynA and feaB
MTAVQAEHWTTGTHGGDASVQLWEDMLSRTHLRWRVDAPDGPVAARARRTWVDDLALIDCACEPCSGTRGRSEIAATDGEFVAVLLTLAGQETVVQGGAEAGLRPGDAVVWVSTAPARFRVWSPLVKRSLLIPRAALAETGAGTLLRSGVRLPASAPAVRLLAGYLDVLSATAHQLDAPALTAARNAALELVAGALQVPGRIPGSGTSRPALRAAMDRYIERHLTGDDVSPAVLAHAVGVSVRTVNRIFHADGQTVGEVVRRRRLARARADLTGGDDPISTIAHRWGFADSSHFCRSFKSCYGRSPGEYRHAAHGADAPSPGATDQSSISR